MVEAINNSERSYSQVLSASNVATTPKHFTTGCAEFDQEASAGLPIPPPAISTSAYADDGRPPDFEASSSAHAHAAGDTVAPARCGKAIIKVMRKAFRAKERRPPRRAPSLPAAPLKRAARARAVHSHTAHGGARKAGDDGDGGDGEPPSGTQSDYGIWAGAEAYAVAKRCGLLDPIPKPRPGYAFASANCECRRRQFSNLFCTKCTPVDRREVQLGGGQ
jgi:hypothetical protein